MELSACIVVYNGAEEALRAAQTVLDCTRRHPLTLYLVDNASPDGSGQCLAKAAKDGTLHIRDCLLYTSPRDLPAGRRAQEGGADCKGLQRVHR